MLAGGSDLGGGVMPDYRLVGSRVQQSYELDSVYYYLHDGAEYIIPVHRGAGEVDDGWLLGLMEELVVRFTAGSVPVLDRARHPLAGAVSPDVSPTEAACTSIYLEEKIYHLIWRLGEKLLALVHAAAGHLVAVPALEGV